MGSTDIARKQRYLAQMTSNKSLSQSQGVLRAERLSPEGAGASGASGAPKSFTNISERSVTPDVARLCEECYARVLYFKEEALRLLKDGHFSPSDPKLSILLHESLRVPSWIGLSGCCDVCFTHLSQLKREAIHMLLNQKKTIWPNSPVARVSPGYDASGSHTLPRAIGSRSPSPNKRQKFSNPRTESWVREHSRFETLWCSNNEISPIADMVSQDGMKKTKDDEATVLCRLSGPLTFNTSKVAAMLPAGTTAAFSFIVRAVQKLHLTSRRRKHRSENDHYPTNFCGLLQKDPPAVPSNLLQTHSKSREIPETAKVRVMVRLNPGLTANSQSQSQALKVDLHKKQVTVLEPVAQNTQRSAAGAIFTPKTFTFDATFGSESSQAKVCEKSLCEVLQSVVAGADGCILSFGQTKAGTSYTMIGRDDGTPNLGIIPCAISWLFKLIKKKKDKTWANISVSVSAVEVCGETEAIRDLLSGFEAGDHTHKPNVYLQEDPVCGIQLYNNRVVSAATEERAAYLLDAALASRNTGLAGCRGTFHHPCHMFYTLHVCQKHIQSSPTSGMYVEQSKLSLIDLGSCTRESTKNNTEVCLLDLGNVIMTKLNGHKHVPNKGSKLAMLIQESLGNVNCHTTIVAHVSTSPEDLSEALCTLQIVSRIRRLQRIRKQACSSPGARSLGKEKKLKDSSKLRAFRYTGSLDHNVSLPHLFDDLGDYSESDKSCDTVFCMDQKGALHDKEVRGNQEFVPIIPSLQRNKADFKSSFSIRHGDILPNAKQMKKLPAQQYSSAPDLECFKCNTFAELQNRLGCINECEIGGLHSCKIQPANAIIKSEPPSSKVVKMPAEKPEIQQFSCKKQGNVLEQGQPTQRDVLRKDIKEIPSEHSVQDKMTQKILPCSPRFHKASRFKQCEQDTESQSLTKTMDVDLSGSSSVEMLPSDKSTLPPKIRKPSVGKNSSTLATALGSSVSFPITRCEVIPQFSTENQGEKATITVTVQQPLDLNGHDELIYSVVKEVEVSGPVNTGKAAKIANIAELDSFKNLPLGSQPVKIIGSVGKEQTPAYSASKVQALGTSDKTSSDISEGKTTSMGQNNVVNSSTTNNPSQVNIRSKESQSSTVTVVAKTDFGSTSQYGDSRFGEEACEMTAEQEDTKTTFNQSSGQLCREIKDKISPTNQRILNDFQVKPAENVVSNYSNYDTSSLTKSWLDTDKQHTSKDSPYPCASWKNETSNSPKTSLDKKCNIVEPSHDEWAKYSKSMPSVPRSDNYSPNKKNRNHVQPTMTQSSTENQLKSTNPKSPTDESTKLFSAKLEQLTSRSRSLSRSNVQCVAVQPFEQSKTVFTQGSLRSIEGNCTPPRVNRHPEKENHQDLGSIGSLEGQYASAHSKSTTCPGLVTVFEADIFTLSQDNHSLKRVPRFFPLYDVDESDNTQFSKYSQSNVSSIKDLSSAAVHKLSGTVPNSPKTNRRSINRSSSLSPDGFSRKQISWSSQSLSRKQAKASISSKYPSKILNGRVEVLRASEDSLSTSSQCSSDIDEPEESESKIQLLSHTLPSPYSRITAPREPNHCSGHASDNTSVLSGELPPAMCKTALLYNRNSMVSSGYESLKRDSETTYSSTSIHDSISDQSCFYSTLKSARSSKKKPNLGSYQRYPSQDTLSSLRKSLSGSKIRWVDRGPSDAYEIKVYEIDNVDSLQRRGKAGNKSVVCFSAKLKFLEHRQQRIAGMRAKYNTLKRELEVAKQHLMVDPEKWTHEFDLWQTFEVDSLEHLEALELVTQRLECQVFRCKAHVMMVTSFDASPKRRQKKKYRPTVDYKGFIGI